MKKYKNSEAKKLSESFTPKSAEEVKLKKTEMLNDIFYINIKDPNSRYAFNDIVYYSEEDRDADFELLVNTMYIRKRSYEEQI